MPLLFLLELDFVDENLAAAGYTNAVALFEFRDPAPVDGEPAFDDAAVDTFAFEADLIEFPGKVSLPLRPYVSDTIEFCREHIVTTTAKSTISEIGLEDQMS